MAKIDELAEEVAKLREEVAQLKASEATTKQFSEALELHKMELVDELAKFHEQVTALQEGTAVPAKGATKPVPFALPAEFKGTKSYRVGPGKHYRAGRIYGEGEVVTVTDEAPDADWTPVETPEAVAPAADDPSVMTLSGGSVSPNGKTDRVIP